MSTYVDRDKINQLVRKAEALAQACSKDDEDIPDIVVVKHEPPSGYVDLVFDEGKLLHITDARGYRTEVGNWLEYGNQRILRIPWPPSLRDPSENRVGRSRNQQITERSAALMQLPKSGTARAQVLSAFIADRRDGGNGLIDEDVAAKLSMNLYTAAPRRTELVNDGWLQASGHYGRTKMKSESIRWELTALAIDKLGLAKG